MDELKKEDIVENSTKNEMHWLSKGIIMILLVLLLITTILAFYQILPMTLLVLGQSLGMLGTREGLPSVVDIAIFILTGMSVTLMSTYGLMQVLKYLGNRIKTLHVEAYAQIKDGVDTRREKRKERKAEKKEKDV